MLSRLKRRWRALFRKEELDRELDDELNFHLAREIEDNLRGGMSHEEAHYAAMKSFGGVEHSKEECRDARGVRLIEEFGQDIRYGLRMLLKQPAFTLIAILTLALGIGANTAIFSVVNALMLNPPSIIEPERVVAIWRTPKDRVAEDNVSYLELQDWRTRNQSFEAIAGYESHDFILLNEGQAERIQGMRVTSNFLSFLKVNLLRGRDFQPEEEQRGAEPVVIISYEFWKDRFGGNESALGQQLSLSGRPFTVIGIMPPSFEFPLAPKQNELLTTIAGQGVDLDHRGALLLFAAGRLKSSASFEQAQAELTNIAENLEQQYPQYNKNVTSYLVRVDEQIVGRDVRRALWVLLGAVAFILLIACTNVANLLLVRASAREKELAVREALGASAWRIARQLLIESFLLALLSAGMGLLIAVCGLGAIKYYGADQLPRLDEIQINARVLVFTLAVSVLTALLFSLIPVLKASRPDLNEVLKSGSKSATSARSPRLWRDSLVVAEVALGLVLLIGAGLMIRSFTLLANVSPGFDPKNVLTGSISLTAGAYSKTEERVRYVNQTLVKLKALPGVVSAAFVGNMPFSGSNSRGRFRIEGRPEPEVGREPLASLRSITSEYFQALRIPLRQGRYFNDQDERRGVGAAIINETLARHYFLNENPIGQRISHIGANRNEGDQEQYEIVGVVGDVHHSSLTGAATPEICLPYQQNSWEWGNFFVRTTGNPSLLIKSFTEEIRSSDKTVPVTDIQPLEDAISSSFAQTRFYAFLFALFGATGLMLTLTGIYSVVSYTVAQRTQEIGLRMALGAQRRDVLHLVARRGLMLTAWGIGLGLAGSFALTRLMTSLLFGVTADDPATFGAVILLLATAALIACFFPARRATKVDPLIALRYE